MQILFKIFQPLPCFPTQSVAKRIKVDALHLMPPITTKKTLTSNGIPENITSKPPLLEGVFVCGLVGCIILAETGSCLGNFGLRSNIWILSQGYIFFVLLFTKDTNEVIDKVL